MSRTDPIKGSFGTITMTPFDGYTCGLVRDFAVIALESDPFTIQWSAIGDITSWPTPGTDNAREVQAGSQLFPIEFGIITGIAGDDFFGYVFQERAITKMTYVGGDVVFSFDTFEEGRGCWEVERFARLDESFFFESKEGYKQLVNGQVVDIGIGFVDQTYPPQRERLTNSPGGRRARKENVSVNPSINCVFFESQNLCYNTKTQQWTRLPFLDGRAYVSIDDPDGIIGQAYGTLGNNYMQIVTSNGGDAQTATITTGANDINRGGRVIVSGVRPLYNGGTHAVRVGVQDRISDAVTWSSTATPLTRTGYANLITEGRYIRAEITTTGGFNTGLGADLQVANGGRV